MEVLNVVRNKVFELIIGFNKIKVNMNRFSHEIPPKTAWTVVAGLVVVFGLVFTAASNGEGKQTGLLGAAVSGATSVSRAVTTIVTAPFVAITNLLVDEPEIAGSYDFASVTNRSSATVCMGAEAAALRGNTAIVSDSFSTPVKRGRAGITADQKVRSAIRAEAEALGLQVIGEVGCIANGIIVPGSITQANKIAFESRGRVVGGFGSGAASAGSPVQGGQVVPAGGGGVQ